MAPLKRRIKIFLKGAYFVNLLAFLAAMVVVNVRQNNNYYQCKSITVRSKCTLGLYICYHSYFITAQCNLIVQTFHTQSKFKRKFGKKRMSSGLRTQCNLEKSQVGLTR